MSNQVYLLLGSNLGEREENLSVARDHIKKGMGTILRASSIYLTRAWGKTDQPDFLNQVVEIQSDLTPYDLLSSLTEIEKLMGRVRMEKWGARVIDIDILFYGDQVINAPNLTIPHPGIPSRKFTLIPLAELAPVLVHPILKKSVQQLLLECEDSLEVVRFQRS